LRSQEGNLQSKEDFILTNEQQTLETVKEYYGKTLAASKDLKTSTRTGDILNANWNETVEGESECAG
jgi:hypothetical protein